MNEEITVPEGVERHIKNFCRGYDGIPCETGYTTACLVEHRYDDP